MPKKRKITKKKSSFLKRRFRSIGIVFFIAVLLCISFSVFQKMSMRNSALKIDNNQDEMSSSDLRTLVNNLISIENKQNPTAAMNHLKKMLGNNRIANECHGITHIIGNNAYVKYKDVSQALAFNDEMCGSGYMHGIIEEKFTEVKNDTQVYQMLPTICFPENSGICFHGVGHGFMWYSSDNLPKALSDCDALQVPYKINNCYDGVFMENFEGDHDVHPTQYINSQNPSYPCDQLDQKYKESCYFYSARYYLALYPNKYNDAFTWCRTQESGYQLTCIKGVGSAMMKGNLNDPNLVANYCNQTKSDSEKGYCIDGLVSYYLTNYYSFTKGLAMCQTLGSENKQQCLASVNKRRNLFPS